MARSTTSKSERGTTAAGRGAIHARIGTRGGKVNPLAGKSYDASLGLRNDREDGARGGRRRGAVRPRERGAREALEPRHLLGPRHRRLELEMQVRPGRVAGR